jgi:TIR domain/PAN domain
MTDIFFSYSSADRERVRPIRDALAEQGFEVFWDQQVPAGMDWDTWIRQHLTKSKCAMAFWSATSVSSDNVRHEATVAKQQGKLISVLLEPLTAEQFPMGLYAQQAANLSGWSGDYSHDEWRKFRREFEAKLTPLWVRRQIDEIEAELVGERTRREGAERRDRTMQAQIAKEVEVQQVLKRERDDALDEVAALKGTVEKLTQARAAATAKQGEAQQALKRERDSAFDEVAALKATVEELTQAREHAEARAVELSQHLRKVRQSKAQDRSIGAALSPLVIAAAVATLGFWTYQLIWPAPQPLPAVISDSTMAAEREQAAIREEQLRQAAADTQAKLQAAEGEQQRLKDEVQRQTKATADAEEKLKAAQAEQQRQAQAAADAEAKRKAAEVEQQRLKVEVQRQTTAAADADTKRRGAEAEQQRLTEELRKVRAEAATKQVAPPQATSTVMAPSFESRPNMEGIDKMPAGSDRGSTLEVCQEKCTESGKCRAFSFNKTSKFCFLYDLLPTFRSNTNYDSGVLTR